MRIAIGEGKYRAVNLVHGGFVVHIMVYPDSLLHQPLVTVLLQRCVFRLGYTIGIGNDTCAWFQIKAFGFVWKVLEKTNGKIVLRFEKIRFLVGWQDK